MHAECQLADAQSRPRARTILKVATEIVRRQDSFLRQGVDGLKPLNLKTVADAIKMHESTVSRVTSNKFMMTPRGVYELKYFFTVSISSAEGGDGHSAEAVRNRIRSMINEETADTVLSDDDIVDPEGSRHRSCAADSRQISRCDDHPLLRPASAREKGNRPHCIVMRHVKFDRNNR